MKKATGKWYEFHKIPQNNDDECFSNQSLQAKLEASQMESLQTKHTVAEAFSVTKLGKIFQQTSATTLAINHKGFSEGLNECSI